ncbi:endonuclease Q family protein [Bacillus cihuensis]|uniref:endonuclease Q family protein n=1 Tax=Bacillus cihuensis TaxID=1208599 RepID=UPI000420E046|nr:endonuclease Q family protein [Bacillus cihuensis]
MNEYYADLHIHIGRTWTGKTVKITGAKSLTLSEVLMVSSERKGLDMIGVIDCHSPEVIEEITELMRQGSVTELAGGGLRFGKTTLIPGSEIEVYDSYCQGPVHVLAYFPTIDKMKLFSNWLEQHVTNIQLSSQRVYCDGKTLQLKVKELNGLFIPAHVFTPFKSLYGKGVTESLTEVFDPLLIDAIELGLSSDTSMAKEINELNDYVFITNSDAHSLGKIAREYQKLELKEPSFSELRMALQEINGRRVVTNYGLDPKLGKYHNTVCAKCFAPAEANTKICLKCGAKAIVKGVAIRIDELANINNIHNERERPPYIHQIPLDFIPGLGPKTMDKLLDYFGSEMNILHETTFEQLNQVVPDKIARYIDMARKGQLVIETGGGGRYGKVKAEE